VIARIAERQHGVVARRQLVDLGMGRRAIGNRLARGRLHAVHRGVYAVGHRRLTAHGRWSAAVLAAGAGAALSHRSAGFLWGMLRSAPGVVEVTVPRRVRVRSAILPHRASIRVDEVTSRDGIPVTTVPRTLLDLAGVLARHRLERAMEEVEARRLTDPLALSDLIVRHPRRRGAATIKAILAAADMGSMPTRSELEDRFLDFLERHRLPRPHVNASLKIGGRWVECDCMWRESRLIVELDGRSTHETAVAFERDRERDRVLSADGWRVVRVTWRQLHFDEDRLAIDLHRLLRVSPRPEAPSAGC
jgi:very-short-patch-repair endonuclease